MAKPILVVDDSLTIQISLERCLSGAGYSVVKAGDGAQALQAVKGMIAGGQAPAMILSDVNMPVMDGISFVKAVKALPECRFVPVVMLTTESQESKKMEGKAAGASGWLIKPFQPDQLLNVVAKFVR